MSSKINFAWTKWILTVVFSMLMFGITTVVSYACGCGNNACPASYTSCAAYSVRCVDSCSGHQFNGRTGSTDWSDWQQSGTQTCTTSASKSRTRTVWDICEKCPPGEKWNRRTETDGPHTLDALGHIDTDIWHNNHDGTHVKRCQRDGASGCNHSILHQESHNTNDGPHQRSDHKDHYDCGAYDCDAKDIRTDDNNASVTFHDPSDGSRSGKWHNSTSTSYKVSSGRHLMGYIKGTQSVTYGVGSWGDRPATRGLVFGPNTSGQLCWYVQKYFDYDRCLNNHDGNDAHFAGQWEWNFVTVNYHTGYYGDATLRTRLVDCRSNLTTESYTLIPNRQGYDLADNGWFESNANTYRINTSWCKCSGSYNNYNSYNSKHRMHFTSDYGKMYRFNTTYSADYYNSAVSSQDYTYRDLYPRWRAHALVITFNANGGVNAPGQQTMYYSDGQSYDERGTRSTYQLPQSVPTRAGYTFMGWGNAARWDNCTSGIGYDVNHELNSATRYSYSTSPAAGYYTDYNGNTTRCQSMTAEAWAAFGGKDLRGLRLSRIA